MNWLIFGITGMRPIGRNVPHFMSNCFFNWRSQQDLISWAFSCSAKQVFRL